MPLTLPLPVPHGDVVLGVRPERLVPATESDDRPALNVTVEVVEPLGSEVMVHGSVVSASGPAAVTARLEAGARPRRGRKCCGWRSTPATCTSSTPSPWRPLHRRDHGALGEPFGVAPFEPPAPGTAALAAAAPRPSASASRQPAPRSSAVTIPPRSASPLPTG